MGPVIMALKEKYGQEIVFIIADLGSGDPESEQLAREFKVYTIPAYFFIDATGALVATETGRLSLEELEVIIKVHLFL